jgi:CheY-like chemotaxis protein
LWFNIVPDQAVILLAEDREDDISLIRKAFKEAYVNYPLHVVRDGEEAIFYLQGSGKYSNRDEFPLPTLLLLDLKMPKVDGFEVLKWIRQQPGLAPLRVLVLTSSENMRDVNLAYRLGANSFLVKPMDFKDVVQMSRFLSDYWIGLSKTPETFRQDRKPKSV